MNTMFLFRFDPIWGPFGDQFCSSWHQFGSYLAPSWSQVGPSWPKSDPSWSQVGAWLGHGSNPGAILASWHPPCTPKDFPGTSKGPSRDLPRTSQGHSKDLPGTLQTPCPRDSLPRAPSHQFTNPVMSSSPEPPSPQSSKTQIFQGSVRLGRMRGAIE